MFLPKGYPCTVEVKGVETPLRTGFRAQLLVESANLSTAEGRTGALYALYNVKGDKLPKNVLNAPQEALEAGLAWHNSAYECLDYGKKAPGDAKQSSQTPKRRTFDWTADEAIVIADFQRFYGLDLTNPSTYLHWYRFISLFLALIRTEDSLLASAIGARQPFRGGGKEAKKAHQAAATFWSLPPSDNELRAMLKANW